MTSKPAHIHSGNLDLLIPANMRKSVAEGGPPIYRINQPDFDRLPLETFLVDAVVGTEGRVPARVCKIVKPNDPAKYPDIKRTEAGRLLYVFWSRGVCVRSLRSVVVCTVHHVVVPGSARHDKIDAFKIACDTRRSVLGRVPTAPTLLCEALGLNPDDTRSYFDLLDTAANSLRPI